MAEEGESGRGEAERGLEGKNRDGREEGLTTVFVANEKFDFSQENWNSDRFILATQNLTLLRYVKSFLDYL